MPAICQTFSDIPIISNIILNLLKSNQFFLTQIESNDWECGDRIIWVGSIWLDLDQDSLSESKQEMNWIRTFFYLVFFIIWVDHLGSVTFAFLSEHLERKKSCQEHCQSNCSTVSADNNRFEKKVWKVHSDFIKLKNELSRCKWQKHQILHPKDFIE